MDHLAQSIKMVLASLDSKAVAYLLLSPKSAIHRQNKIESKRNQFLFQINIFQHWRRLVFLTTSFRRFCCDVVCFQCRIKYSGQYCALKMIGHSAIAFIRVFQFENQVFSVKMIENADIFTQASIKSLAIFLHRKRITLRKSQRFKKFQNFYFQGFFRNGS